uniref:Uncharacterized protein n=1 Tax=Noctiluca scintillans TaxID=2966 RepID=A0A7S1FF84_NOCSC|mmetsp:Transcript_56060/g.149562  ORF Transcript_56060/g.149562 Transcript_56060/m.149562 type:complete len:136 (+) Transcript_56060:11-418(+)
MKWRTSWQHGFGSLQDLGVVTQTHTRTSEHERGTLTTYSVHSRRDPSSPQVGQNFSLARSHTLLSWYYGSIACHLSQGQIRKGTSFFCPWQLLRAILLLQHHSAVMGGFALCRNQQASDVVVCVAETCACGLQIT